MLANCEPRAKGSDQLPRGIRAELRLLAGFAALSHSPVWVKRVLRARSSGNRATGVHRRLTFAGSLRVNWSGILVTPHQPRRMTMEISNASHVLNAEAGALEHGQAHRPKATVAAKTCLVDSYPIADARTDA